MRALSSALAAALTFAGAAMAADQNKDFAVRGAGSAPCAKFSKDKATESRDYYVFAGWLDGYLTGENEARADTFDLAPWQTTELLLALLNDFCLEHPQVPFIRAARRMIEALDVQKLATKAELLRVEHNDRFTLIYAEILRRAQERLKVRGLYAGAADGAYSQQTREAIARFQQEKGYEATGLPDQRTLAALLSGPPPK